VGSERVLEVGAGYAWQSALLARLCGFVWAVERFGDVAEVARDNLARFGVTNAEVVTDDGTKGLPEHAPYHAILVAAAFQSVPRPLEEQLAAGGRLVQPVGPGGREEVVLFERALEGSCGAAQSRGPASSGSTARTRSRSSRLSWSPFEKLVTTPRPIETNGGSFPYQGSACRRVFIPWVATGTS
jgi:protein-L-isoaspartate O-methyltransferase